MAGVFGFAETLGCSKEERLKARDKKLSEDELEVIATKTIEAKSFEEFEQCFKG